MGHEIWVQCTSCHGSGKIDTNNFVCDGCSGNGYIWDGAVGNQPCPICGGSGFNIHKDTKKECPACAGYGKVRDFGAEKEAEKKAVSAGKKKIKEEKKSGSAGRKSGDTSSVFEVKQGDLWTVTIWWRFLWGTLAAALLLYLEIDQSLPTLWLGSWDWIFLAFLGGMLISRHLTAAFQNILHLSAEVLKFVVVLAVIVVIGYLLLNSLGVLS
ncbi:hypothetical protein [uncultured Cohaesibacter sp.]|uniref:hypothetical protein n=1 Tax=uncultured Cohaesibacter sp. TaxID=1002546 RepID=UPI0029C77BD5|nr:hypothetical protein [uncultured Cohaesibacter sp.]